MDPLDLAVHLCDRADAALADARPEAALELAQAARLTVAAPMDPLAAGVFVRASTAAASAAALSDDLDQALIIAHTAVGWAEICGASEYVRIAAHLTNAEIVEMRREYHRAGSLFETLARCLAAEEWGAALAMRAANHLISIGVHNADPDLAEIGIKIGWEVRARVHDPDEVSAWLQWVGLYHSRRYRFDQAAESIYESFELRGNTRRRAITRLFLDAELAFIESDSSGVATLTHAVSVARAAGLERHARAASRHMSRFLV